MVRAEHIQGAYGALNAALVMLRPAAHEEQPIADLAEALGHLEYLPRLLSDEEDRTDQFRATLVTLAALHERFEHALQRFDHPTQAW